MIQICYHVIVLSSCKKVLLHLCPAAGYLALKNTTTFTFAHDLPVVVFYAIVLANKIFSKRKYYFSNLQTCKYTLLEVCKFEKIFPVGTRLDISLKKTTTTFKFAHDLPVAVFYAMVFAKKIFSHRENFFSNLKNSKKNCVFRSL